MPFRQNFFPNMTIEKAPSADEAFRLFTEVFTDPGLEA
jgi:hypothetical protein